MARHKPISFKCNVLYGLADRFCLHCFTPQAACRWCGSYGEYTIYGGVMINQTQSLGTYVYRHSYNALS